MLSRSTRSKYQTLLHAAALTSGYPDQPAIIFLQTGQTPIIVSNAEFRNAVTSYAAALQELGLGAGDFVAIAETQNLQSIYAFWGALYLGALPSMFAPLTDKLDPKIYRQQMAQLVDLSGVKLLLISDDFESQLAQSVSCPVQGIGNLIEAAASSNAIEPLSVDADAIAFLQHSSGTTGLQKGVALSHRAVLNQLASYSDALRLSAEDVIVSWLPLYHDMGLIAGFILPLLQGIPLVLMSPFDWVANPALLFQAISHYRGTLCWLPNFAYNHCTRRIRDQDLEGISLETMRAFINCSEPVRHDSHQDFLGRFAALGLSAEKLAVSYAMAENVFAVTQTPIGEVATVDWIDQDGLTNKQCARPVKLDHERAVAQVSCGPPIAGVEIRVLDFAGEVQPDRTVGVLAIKSASLLSDYHARDDLQPLDSEGWYRTGDMGYLADGKVYVVGRSKDLIINAGKNVYPQDIEAVLNTIPGVYPGRAVAFGVTDVREGTELIAVVAEVETEDSADHRQLKKLIRQRISQQTMVTVSFIELVEPRWLIKTSSGKIARAANREKWLANR